MTYYVLHAVSTVFGKTIRSSDASDHVARRRGPDSAVHGHCAVRPGSDPGGCHRAVPDRFRRARRAGVRVLFHGRRDKGRHHHGFVSGAGDNNNDNNIMLPQYNHSFILYIIRWFDHDSV